ncbi:MAG: sigma 54-interacting transcriptional regulator [bacterium]
MDGTSCFQDALACRDKKCPAPCRMILDNVPDGVMALDGQGLIAWFNRAAEGITGFQKEEVLGKPCRIVFQTDLCGTADCPLERALRQESTANLEVCIRNKWGRPLPVSVSMTALRDPNGRVIGSVETFRDLSLSASQEPEGQRGPLKNIITQDPAMLSILHHLRDLARSDSPVLLSGESGTGKELLARAIHELSARREKPYVAVNCGALPDTLMESELFGYRRGAFTDAKENKPGRFALADGGTLFLDEIGDLPLELQVKLLRAIEGGEHQPLGSTETVRADVRIVTATNKDLFEQMERGRFRRDLFFRIHVVHIDVPPLRQRREDLPLLIRHFLERLNQKRNKRIGGLSPEAEEILRSYPYPGNIRELENILEYATIVCKGIVIEPGHLPAYLLKRSHGARESPASIPARDLRQVERDEILETLKSHRWNRQAAARALGVSRTTLWRRIRRMQKTS